MLKNIENQNLSVINNDALAELAEKVILNHNLAALKPAEKFMYIKQICNDLKLNMLTKPIQLISFQGKEIIYFTKDATEQIRNKNNISIVDMESKVVNGIYIVKVTARDPFGRIDSSTGAVSIEGLKGDALCNAMMKAETKSKRRVTLSISGLGVLDESEIDTMRGAVRIDAYVEQDKIPTLENLSLTNDSFEKFEELKEKLKSSKNIEELKSNFDEVNKLKLRKDDDYLSQLISIKDEQKKLITSGAFEDVQL